MIGGYIDCAMINPYRSRAICSQAFKGGLALALAVAVQCVVPSTAAADSWALRIRQVDPKSSDPAVTMHCSQETSRLCTGEMALLWYGERRTVALTGLVRGGYMFLKFRLGDHDLGDRYLYVSALPYVPIQLGNPALRSSTYSTDVSLSEPPPHAGEGWPSHWPEGGYFVPAATLRIDVQPEQR